jgi:hypothetical protein
MFENPEPEMMEGSVMKRAAEWYPPQPVTKLELAHNAAVQTVSLRSISVMGMLAVAALTFASVPAFSQRTAGGSQTAVGGSHVGGTDSNASGARINSSDAHAMSAEKSSAPESSKNAPAGMPVASDGVQSESLLAGSASVAPAAALPRESGEKEVDAPRRPLAPVYPQKVIIGFPPQNSGELQIPAETLHKGGAVVTGQRNELWAEAPQRGPAAQHAGGPIGSAPVTTGRPVVASRAPVGGVRFAPPPRPMSRAGRPSPLSFLQGPAATSPPRVFGPRRGRPRFFGGFGFFGFGFGSPFFDFGFVPSCNPFWAWPWAFGCESFGYWDGYAAGFYEGYNASFYQPEEQQEMEPPPEKPETYIYVPPTEPSSPEEIEAEKVLVVLYMNNGAVYAVTNYWVGDGKLHYLTSYGGENTINLNDLDLQKTVDVNASRGVEFSLKPAPEHKQPNPPDPQD